jgi:hypothetical protein
MQAREQGHEGAYEPLAQRNANRTRDLRITPVTAERCQPELELLGQRHQPERIGIEPRAIVASVHQNATQAALDRLDAASDGRASDAERLARCKEALVTMDRQQDAKVVPRRLLGLHICKAILGVLSFSGTVSAGGG